MSIHVKKIARLTIGRMVEQFESVSRATISATYVISQLKMIDRNVLQIIFYNQIPIQRRVLWVPDRMHGGRIQVHGLVILVILPVRYVTAQIIPTAKSVSRIIFYSHHLSMRRHVY